MLVRLCCALAVAAALSAAPVRAAEPDPEVAATLTAFVEAMNALDLERFQSFFAEDATSFYPGEPHPEGRVSGRAAVAAEFKGLFDDVRGRGGKLTVSPADLEIRRWGDTALATFHLDRPTSMGRRTMVLRREADGWRIVHLHASARPKAAVQSPRT